MKKVILASQSPRRKQLLELAGIAFDVIVKETDESYPEDLKEPKEIALHIAMQKALPIYEEHKESIIIAADTIVVLNGRIMGKPKDKEHALSMLTALSGNKHQVITAVVVVNEGRLERFAEITNVFFYPLSTQDIHYYIDNYAPFDKAGGYGIQDWLGITGIEKIEGDFYNVMGLPVGRLLQLLKKGN